MFVFAYFTLHKFKKNLIIYFLTFYKFYNIFARKFSYYGVLPKEVLESMKVCSDFIDKNKKENPPTQKQLDFAKKIAEAKGITLSKEVENSFKACSYFINKFKDSKSK